jgi:cellobiose dehydrogenase (acceptor)
MARVLLFTAAVASLHHLASAQAANCSTVDSTKTYDYIVIGSGAGGIPVADRLSEAGHSVLLVEKGPLSSGRFNGTMKPAWLQGTNLTRFDVPGLFNEIWRDTTGVACEDLDVMAGW